MNLSPPILVQSSKAWNACLAELEKQSQLAIDTESNSLHAYREQVCLIQISIPEQDYIIDPLVIKDLDGLGEIMGDPAVEKIFHAAEYDLILMKREYGFSFTNLFDTMLAARVLGWKQLGLASILKQEFNVKLDKRFQRANWGKRPLTPEQIAYARLDTHFLLDLRNRLFNALKTERRLDEARESFEHVSEVIPSHRVFDPDDFWSLVNGYHQLQSQQLAVLRELYIFREREAQRRNVPPFKILGNRTLVELAQTLPHFQDECQGIHGLTRRVLCRYGRQILQTIQTGLHAEQPEPPTRTRKPPQSVLDRFKALHNWRKESASTRGVESDVILRKEALWEMAYQNPKTIDELECLKSLSDWQRERYGREVLEVLDQMREK
ncbi:MAG: ribonuclease D [Anaerolineales bacterium]|nr:ribonuclease D [Anaerolineales bacterium]